MILPLPGSATTMNLPLRPCRRGDDGYAPPMGMGSPHGSCEIPPLPLREDLDSAFGHYQNTPPQPGYFGTGRSVSCSAGVGPRSPFSRSPFPTGIGPSGFGSLNYGPTDYTTSTPKNDIFLGPDFRFDPDRGIEEHVRSTNLTVQLANGRIPLHSRYAQLQPKMCRSGRFPEDFRSARTVEEIKAMDSSTLERILLSYQLPTDLRAFKIHSADGVSAKVAKQAKLCTLYDFLGAVSLAQHERLSAERWKNSMVLAY